MAVDRSDQSILQYEHTVEESVPLREDARHRRYTPERSASVKVQEYEKGRSVKRQRPWAACCRRVCLSWIGADWIFLMLLGVALALLSFLMDIFIFLFMDAHRFLYHLSDSNVMLQYLTWITFPLLLMLFAAGFTQMLAPQASGSGIPEIKIILRGLMMKEYLTLKTLAVKVISLVCVLGSELPVGKEGPFVHFGALCAALLCKFMSFFSDIYKNEARNLEMLTAGCAVGIGCCFAAPVGGVLFSIEVTSVFFVVRNYWRGLMSSVFGILIFRLLAVWNKEEETIMALFPTKFRLEYPFDLQELPAFAVMGIACGFGGALFVYLNGKIALFVKKQKAMKNFLLTNCFIYSGLVSVFISSLTFPPGFGQFMAGQLTQRDSLISFFDNRTWSKEGIVEDFHPHDHLSAWKHPQANVFIILSVFIIMKFWMSALSITLPIPAGSFVPVFVIGAAFGRLVGEGMATLFPDGFETEHGVHPIIPGAYAVVGAAALTAGITHTISTAVIMIELTGQIRYGLPILIAVILSNIISQNLQPSIYDSIIRLKKLPYLPELGWGHQEKYNLHVEDFMVRDVRYITLKSTYRDLLKILRTGNLKKLPLVKSEDSMILLGSVERAQIRTLLKQHAKHLRDLVDEERQHASERSSEESPGPSARPVSPKPHKPALKRSSVTETDTDVHKKFSIKNLFCGDAQSIMIEDDSDSEDEVTLREIEEWEGLQLDEQVNFNNCKIDPAPFQLVERTSLHKAHTMFFVLSLDQAYVTSIGRLIGVVSLKELRKAVEGSLTDEGLKLRPVLDSFQDCGTGANNFKSEKTELHKLLDPHSDVTH
ncbi:chloride channel protein 2-like isoform X2 [Triplophysa dalaica]|uniref:chloride channel protein 2-like isoform X2 n=1 Tax=Triplophysa dalaica TaxID=1582913 RepID=UPI0024DF4517|nr:chloride channel protein 2-like isoform X2 [Triplophysa dalaica]XP_056613561.1 chloride channel protein 2-like isoform X2 [Triplophysa dalaica]